MDVVKFVKTLILTGTLFFVTHESYALSALDINYPSSAQLKQLQMTSVQVKSIEPKSRLLARVHKRRKASHETS